MKKKVIISSLLVVFCCLILVSCGESPSTEQEKYSYNRESFYMRGEDSDPIFEEFQYYDSVLYGLLARYVDGSIDIETREVVTIDLSSGDQRVYFDKETANELGNINNFAFDSNGDLWILSSDESYILSKIVDGKVDTQIKLDISTLEHELHADQMIYIDEKGQFYINFDYQGIFILNTEGQTVAEIACEGGVQNFIKLQDKIYVTYSGESYRMAEINVEGKKLESPETITDQYISDICSAEGLGAEYCFYDENGIYAVDDEDNITQLFGWTDYGLASSYPDKIFVTPKGDVLCCSWDSIFKFERVSADKADKRQVLTLAAFEAGDALKNLVADFNSSNEEYMVSIVDYSTYNTDSDKYAGLNKLNTEIISGNPPDLIDLRNIDAEQYISKGILEDLYPFIDEDLDLNREDFLENVLTAMGDGNKLYGLTTTFRINTIIAKTSDMDLSNWNLQGLKEMFQSNPEVFVGGTKISMLELACTYMQDNFVDWDSNTASFDSPEFISFLEACNALPEESEIIEIYDFYFADTEDLSTYAGVNISSFSDLHTYEDIWRTDTSIIEYPETGNTIGLRMYVGILSNSNNKDAAWSFLRTTLMPDAQEPIGEWAMGLPISKSGFEKARVQARADDGSEEYIINTETNETYENQLPTKEQVEKVAEVALSIDKLSSNNTVIKDLVLEEAQAYFSGDKSAQDAAEIIQNRVATYINEQAN